MQLNYIKSQLPGITVLLLLLIGLSACFGLKENRSTVVDDPLTSTPVRSSTPSEVELPTALPVVLPVTTTGLTPTTPPTISVPTLNPVEIPADPHPDVVIITPGSKSTIVSPLKPVIFINVQDEGIVQVELIGKGGYIFARQILDLHSLSGQETQIRPIIPFEITKSSEPARLVVKLIDRLQRVISSASSNLTLLSSGEETIQQTTTSSGSILITSPTAGEQISGKKVHITARVVPINNEPVIAELLTKDGAAINTKLVYLPSSDTLNRSVTLDIVVPYSVKSITPSRITLYQASYNQIEGILMLSSVLVTLLP